MKRRALTTTGGRKICSYSRGVQLRLLPCNTAECEFALAGLSPAFDINPDPHRGHLSLAIDEADTSLNLEVAIAAGAMYGLKKNRVATLIGEVRNAVAGWRHAADELGIARREQQMMSRAFLPNES